jgi:hypothetical protein
MPNLMHDAVQCNRDIVVSATIIVTDRLITVADKLHKFALATQRGCVADLDDDDVELIERVLKAVV